MYFCSVAKEILAYYHSAISDCGSLGKNESSFSHTSKTHNPPHRDADDTPTSTEEVSVPSFLNDNRVRKIEGYSGYFITSFGVVLSYKNKKAIELKPRMNRKGYLYVNLCENAKYKSTSIHRLVAKYFLPDYSEELEVNHIDGNKTNNNVENLEMTTRSENIRHAERNGLTHHLIGERHCMAKLKERDVLDIREMYSTGRFSRKEIAKKYNVSYCLIGKIVNFKLWKCVK